MHYMYKRGVVRKSYLWLVWALFGLGLVVISIMLVWAVREPVKIDCKYSQYMARSCR